MELSKLRERIDKVDNEIKALLKERFALSKEVCLSKMQSGSKVIYRADREREVLDNLTQDSQTDEARQLREIYKNIMVNSRNIQYNMLVKSDEGILDDLNVQNMDDLHINSMLCQGIDGAYSHIAARKLSDANIVHKDCFKDVFSGINGQNVGILPLDNSTQGMVSEVYDLLLKYGLYIVKSIDLPIDHVCMAKKGYKRENLAYIMAHEQALAQCSEYIGKNNLKRISAINNAVAARDVAQSDKDDICCIGDISNASRYGLDVVDEHIANSKENTTKFIMIADKMYVPQSGGKVSLVLSMENSSGTLANVLNIISSYEVSMSKIESRPIADDKWEYIFYIDLIGNIRDESMKALIFELKSELPFVRVLGSFEEV